MKYPVTLLVLAAVMLLVGIGIRMHADWKYTNKMFYHTVQSGCTSSRMYSPNAKSATLSSSCRLLRVSEEFFG